MNRCFRIFVALLVLSSSCCGQSRKRASAAGSATVKAAHSATPWWKGSLLYEIYPRSFQDSDGDGIGDLNGITQRLDYLRDLGVDAIWIAPMFPSPQVDFGYDISDYESVDAQYGTMADFDRLVAEAKKRHIRVLLDMVLNHTSDRHVWFAESASSRDNAKADWFMWNDGVPASGAGVTAFQKRFEHDGRVPPNNWVSLFGGSAWEWAPARQQFYYHNFYRQQPDLNWRNPAVEKAMFGAMKFWLDRGVAGFRLDAITSMFEDPQLRNNPETGVANAYGDPAVLPEYTDNLPEVHDVVRRMRAMSDTFSGDRVLIGETYLPNTLELDKWYGGAAKNELQLPMDMLIGVRGATLDAAKLRRYICEVQTQVHGSEPLLVFDNHDNVRSWDRFGDGAHNAEIARQIATMLLTVRSTALMYYGQELGMTTRTPVRVEEVKDPIGLRGWPKQKGRDGERTPMQWDATAHAGFSANANTWLPVSPDYTERNVKTEAADAQSLLNWHRRMIALRRSVAALREGDMVTVHADSPEVLSYVRKDPGGKGGVLVMMNMSARELRMGLGTVIGGVKVTSMSTLMASHDSLRSVHSFQQVLLPPYSTWVIQLR